MMSATKIQGQFSSFVLRPLPPCQCYSKRVVLGWQCFIQPVLVCVCVCVSVCRSMPVEGTEQTAAMVHVGQFTLASGK